MVDWNYNAWGGKYPPFDQDDIIPTLIARHYNLPLFNPGIIMEGGSVEFNGNGTILTSTCCLLNENRNPHLNREQVENYLHAYYGAQQMLWVEEGIVGDDTDGHIDDLTRFVAERTVVTVVESDPHDENYEVLQENLERLRSMAVGGRPLEVVELPMPPAVVYEDQRLPASYANFYLTNGSVLLPGYDRKTDERAKAILSEHFPTREVVVIDCTDLIWGLGAFHCLTQQVPKAE